MPDSKHKQKKMKDTRQAMYLLAVKNYTYFVGRKGGDICQGSNEGDLPPIIQRACEWMYGLPRRNSECLMNTVGGRVYRVRKGCVTA